jgi:hypothetical protein
MKYFKLKCFKQNNANKAAIIPSNMVKIINNKLQIAPNILDKINCMFKLSKRTISKRPP